jgi:hypothetical protein
LYEQHKAEKTLQRKKLYTRKSTRFLRKRQNMRSLMSMIKRSLLWSNRNQRAHWLDETVYKNNIPSNELEKWLKVEYERSGIGFEIIPHRIGSGL